MEIVYFLKGIFILCLLCSLVIILISMTINSFKRVNIFLEKHRRVVTLLLLIFFIFVAITVIGAITTHSIIVSYEADVFKSIQEKCISVHDSYPEEYNFCPNCGVALDE